MKLLALVLSVPTLFTFGSSRGDVSTPPGIAQPQPQQQPPAPTCRDVCRGSYLSCGQRCGSHGEDCARICRARRDACVHACEADGGAH